MVLLALLLQFGGDDDKLVELEHADATSEDPFEEFPLELAVLLFALVFTASTTSVSASIRCRLMTGCSLADDEDEDEEEVAVDGHGMPIDSTGGDSTTLAPLPVDPPPFGCGSFFSFWSTIERREGSCGAVALMSLTLAVWRVKSLDEAGYSRILVMRSAENVVVSRCMV